MKKFVAYYRVSTQRQGQSGLGLEAQEASVAQYIGTTGTVIEAFTEVESGKKDKRPRLLAAIDAAKRAGAQLVIAKLDRLSRNASFIFTLRDAGVDFVCADIPDANTLTIGIFAIIAQHERETISKRTKAALAAKKARGGTLGNPKNLTDAHRRLGTQQGSIDAQEHDANIKATGIIKLMEGKTLQAVADHLNEHGYKTRRGCSFTPATVQRLRDRM